MVLEAAAFVDVSFQNCGAQVLVRRDHNKAGILTKKPKGLPSGRRDIVLSSLFIIVD